MKKKNRKTKKRFIIFIALLMAFTSIWYWNNFTIRTTEQTILSDKINGEVQIVLISDLHGASFGKDNSRLIKKISDANPNLIFVLGDMYSCGHTEDIEKTVKLIENLTEITDTFLITGDHDTDDSYKQELKKLKNLHYLSFESQDITVNGTDITVYGVDNVYFSPTYDLNNAFTQPDSNRLNILLAHIPQYPYYDSFNVDLIFCGDSHGGMIRLPFLGGIYYEGYLFPKITYPGEVTDKGLYQYSQKSMFVTSGLGWNPLPIRLNNRPEICKITLKGV